MLFMNNSPEYHTERCAALAPFAVNFTALDMVSHYCAARHWPLGLQSVIAKGKIVTA